MDNPIKAIRKAARLTQQQVADRYDYNRQYIADLEHGEHSRIPSRYLEVLREISVSRKLELDEILSPYGTRFVQDAYANWVDAERRQVEAEGTLNVPFTWQPGASVLHPLTWYILATCESKSAFATTLKVNRGVITRCLTGDIQTLPTQIENALRQVGYADVNLLVQAVENWNRKVAF